MGQGGIGRVIGPKGSAPTPRYCLFVILCHVVGGPFFGRTTQKAGEPPDFSPSAPPPPSPHSDSE